MTPTIYTKNNCQPCRLTKGAFERGGVEFNEINLDENPEALAEVLELGYQSAPVIVYGDTHWAGLNPDKIKQVIADHS